ncbi:hypothetical protein [Chitinophaga agri]|uniref:Uncharacterized protein n=1 Tax=Chitinophaga agri TaxID=2703787 RepID=A0A6B9ZC63_9BACT|nr:hypothetical protein [Chitinophaga agri]QHS58904.1 hypothetical protein GWR21_04605 [Chitinophaga agri]
MSVCWAGIGTADVWYSKGKWWLGVRILLIRKQWPLESIITSATRKRNTSPTRAKGARTKKRITAGKTLSLIRTFQVMQCQLAIDSNDVVLNAWMYGLNFLPDMRKHLYVNFQDINFFTITIRNKVWRLVYAWFK